MLRAWASADRSPPRARRRLTLRPRSPSEGGSTNTGSQLAVRVAAVAEAVRRRPTGEAALAMRVVAYLAAVAAVGGADFSAGGGRLAPPYPGGGGAPLFSGR